MEKFLLASALIGLAAVANAGTRFNQYPTVGGVAVNNLCDAGSSFQTKAPVAVCTKWMNTVQTGDQYSGNQWTCESSVTKTVKISKAYEVATCNNASPINQNIEANYPVACKSKTTMVKTYGNTFAVPVYEDQGETGLVVVATAKYTVPACK